MADSGPTLVQFRMRRENGAWRDVEAVVVDQLHRPSVAGYVANVRDITERKEFEALLAHRALHDPLTGLANRQLILDRAEQMLARSRRSLEPVAAYFIDLDNFKDANDSLGHEAGDKLLQAVATRFIAMLRASDTVGRLGGDEFVILAEGISLSAGPDLVAERIREVLREPFHIEGFDGIPITVTASIGIALGDRAIGPGPAPRRRHRPVPGQGGRPGRLRACSSPPCSWPPWIDSSSSPTSTRRWPATSSSSCTSRSSTSTTCASAASRR